MGGARELKIASRDSTVKQGGAEITNHLVNNAVTSMSAVERAHACSTIREATGASVSLTLVCQLAMRLGTES